jgi:hypothetical protein
MDQKVFITALIGALLGLIPTIASALIVWIEKRDRANQREQAIEFAGKQVTFLSSWLEARQQSETGDKLDKIKEMIAAELDEIKAHVDEALEIQVEAPAKRIKERNFIQRAFLLYAPQSMSARVYRTLFFVFLGMTLLVGAFWVSIPNQDFGALIIGVIIFVFPFMLPAILFNRLAVRSDRKAEEKMAPAK